MKTSTEPHLTNSLNLFMGHSLFWSLWKIIEKESENEAHFLLGLATGIEI